MTHGSLFSGIGLLDYGLTLAGLTDPEWVVEFDDWRRDKILAHRFPDAVRHADVRAVGAGNLEPVRLVVGGFPCKGASTAGKRNGFEHPETVLWREMLRVVRELRPQHVLLENVANLLALHHGAVWGEVLGDLATLGYGVTWDCIPAAAVGAPHRRDRVFAVATHTEGGPEGRAVAPRRERAGRSGPTGGAADVADAGCVGGELRGGPELAAGTDRRAEGEVREQRTRDTAGRGGEDAADPCAGGRRQDIELVWSGQPDADRCGEALADADDSRQPKQSERDRQRRGGVDGSLGDDAQRRGVRVEWGSFGPAIERWERELGRPAPEPLVRRVDDRSASRVERSRLSALGDGVQVQVGQLVGAYLLSIDPSLAGSEGQEARA